MGMWKAAWASRECAAESSEDTWEVGKESVMGDRPEDGFGCIWVARIGHAGIEWNIVE